MSVSDESEDPGWQTIREYTDHLGYPVVLEQYIESHHEPDDVHLVPIQVYSLYPLDQDHEKLRDYFLGSQQQDSENLPLFEFYSYLPPNPYACINHHRREIAHRKQQHREGAPDPPPLIPQVRSTHEGHPMGCCILIRSDSYRLGHVRDEEKYDEYGGEGPDLLWFNRSFSDTRPEADMLQRQPRPRSWWYNDRSCHPEAFEISVERIRNHRSVPDYILHDIFWGAGEILHSRLEFGMEIDEGEPSSSGPAPEDDIRLQLHRQLTARGYELTPGYLVSHNAGVVTITNTLEGAKADIQYAVHASFLSHLATTSQPGALEITARLFTTALVSHLPPSKTITLKFCVPDSNNWGAILPAHTKAFGKHSCELPTGAVHTFSRSPSANEPVAEYRVSPQLRRDSIEYARQLVRDPYQVFAVVLDRANFVDEAGVYFFMADNSSGEADIERCPKMEVWRCTSDMALIARRLAMLVLEEDGRTVQ
ncbi:hypothetical protein BDV19DRAFT_364074 [Aspergillus venezuelensis]